MKTKKKTMKKSSFKTLNLNDLKSIKGGGPTVGTEKMAPLEVWNGTKNVKDGTAKINNELSN